MKTVQPPVHILWAAFALSLMAGAVSQACATPMEPAGGAAWLLAGDRGGDADRARGLDRAIKIVLRRTGGQYVSAEPTGDDTFRVVVRIGPRIVAYRVNVRNDSMEEE